MQSAALTQLYKSSLSVVKRQGKLNLSSVYKLYEPIRAAIDSNERGVREVYKQNQVAHNQKHNLWISLARFFSWRIDLFTFPHLVLSRFTPLFLLNIKRPKINGTKLRLYVKHIATEILN